MVVVLSDRRASLLIAALVLPACGADSEPAAAPAPELAAPRLHSPTNNAYVGSVHVPGSLAPTFRWEPIDGAAPASGYEVQVSEDVAFQRALITFPAEDTQLTPTLELPVSREPPVGQRYYWRVRACDGTTCSPYSPARTLHLGRSDHDVNGDGYADMLAYLPGVGRAGTIGSNIYLGGRGPTFDADPDGTVVAPVADGTSVVQVASAGDVNGDGFADIIMGSRVNSGAGSAAFVYFGGRVLRLDTAPDLVLQSNTPDDGFGYAVAGAGDLNGDGFGDLVVAAPFGERHGAVYVYLGGAERSMAPAVTLRDERCTGCVAFGVAVAAAGDVDGDGYDDLAVAANDGRDNARVVFGDAAGRLDASAGLASSGLSSIVGGGDVDDDGFADVLASGLDSSARLYFGNADRARLNVSSVTYREIDPGFGHWVALPGDVDGDGFADLLVGADPHNEGSFGGAYLYAGGPRSTLATLAFSKIAGTAATVSLDNQWRVGAPGDVNGDGFADLAISNMPAALSRSGLIGSTFLYAGGNRLALDAPAYGTLHAKAAPVPGPSSRAD